MRYTFVNITQCNMCGSAAMRILGRRLNQSQGFFPSRKVGISTTVMECGQCGLVFSNPMPIPNHISDHYDIKVEDYFEEALQHYNEDSFESELTYFKSIYHESANLKALDIGAGLGGIMRAMKKNKIEAYGIEPSRSFYDFAVQKMGIDKDYIVNQSIEEANFSNNFFDFIVFSSVFEHLYNPCEALRRSLQWLKPKGIILVGVPSSRSLNQVLINFLHKIRFSSYVSNLSPMHPPYHLYEFTEKSFMKNGKLNNYSIEKTDRVTFQTYLPSFLSKLARPVIKLTGTDMSLIIWIRKNNA